MRARRIFKYRLHEEYGQNVVMPKGAEILCVQTQSDVLHLWAIVNPFESSLEDRKIVIVGTGNPMPDSKNLLYIGTAQQGIYVWHVFEDTAANGHN